MILTNPQPNSPGFWQGSKWYLAQVLHVLAGALIVDMSSIHGWNVNVALGLLLVITGIKEFVIDLSGFEKDSLWGSVQDWFFYQAGAVAGYLTTIHFWSGACLLVFTVLFIFAVDLYRNANWSVFASWFKWLPF